MCLLKVFRFNNSIWLVLLLTFFTRASFFSIWPFISLLLIDYPEWSMMKTGYLLGSSTSIVLILGLFTGHLSDKYGRKPLLVVGLILMSLGAFLLNIAQEPGHVVWAVILLSIGKGSFDVPIRTLLSDVIKDSTDKEKIFNTSYFLSNLGSAIYSGPHCQDSKSTNLS